MRFSHMDAAANTRASSGSEPGSHRVLLLATDGGAELVDELCRELPSGGSEILVVAPSVERTGFQHAMGDVDGARVEAERRLETIVSDLRGAGLRVSGEVGDSDPLIAAEDVLRKVDVDEIVIVAHTADQARWFDGDLFDRAQRELEPPVRLLHIHRDEGGTASVADVERAGPGLHDPDAHHHVHLYENMPAVHRGDMVGIVVAIVGTIVTVILAAAGPGPQTTAGAIQILVAIGISLINMAHVVGLLLLESVTPHSAAERFFRTLSTIGTPTAVVVNALLLIFS
jgi:Cu/Zn superoxide dismutase